MSSCIAMDVRKYHDLDNNVLCDGRSMRWAWTAMVVGSQISRAFIMDGVLV